MRMKKKEHKNTFVCKFFQEIRRQLLVKFLQYLNEKNTTIKSEERDTGK